MKKIQEVRQEMPKLKTKPLPFHVDLGGHERVNRALARKLWAWGLPVRIDAGNGAARLEKPAAVPEKTWPEPAGPFYAACLRAAPECAKPTRYRNAVFLVPSGSMCVHLGFADGSNPFVKYGTCMELFYELRAWSMAYSIGTEASGTDRVAAFRLESRRAPGPLF